MGGADALGTPFSCIIGLVDSLGIIFFNLSLGTCKLGPIFNDNLFLPWFNDPLVGNSIVMERESLSFIIKFHGISSNHELVVYALLACGCKCSCMRSTRTPFLTTSHELIFRLMGLTISLRKASMICLQMKRSRLSTLLGVVSNMERNIV